MAEKILITSGYFKDYQRKLGFSSQVKTQDFFGAKDIIPRVDLKYITVLNDRLYNIVDKINFVVTDEIKLGSPSFFKKEYIDNVFETLRKNKILPTLNNQGRRPEQVYFSWMRGFVISNFFLKTLEIIFEVSSADIVPIGDDDFRSAESFKRTPKADWEIRLSENEKIRIEIQSGFTGLNDIKQHKVLEAKKIFRETGVHSVGIHLDLFNGQVAFVKLDEVEDGENWITRSQMEGQLVFNISQNYFVWKIMESPIKYKEIDFG
ncbi:MAG: restriction endonuclease [Patescibacteria group bacterium]